MSFFGHQPSVHSGVSQLGSQAQPPSVGYNPQWGSHVSLSGTPQVTYAPPSTPSPSETYASQQYQGNPRQYSSSSQEQAPYYVTVMEDHNVHEVPDGEEEGSQSYRQARARYMLPGMAAPPVPTENTASAPQSWPAVYRSSTGWEKSGPSDAERAVAWVGSKIGSFVSWMRESGASEQKEPVAEDPREDEGDPSEGEGEDEEEQSEEEDSATSSSLFSNDSLWKFCLAAMFGPQIMEATTKVGRVAIEVGGEAVTRWLMSRIDDGSHWTEGDVKILTLLGREGVFDRLYRASEPEKKDSSSGKRSWMPRLWGGSKGSDSAPDPPMPAPTPTPTIPGWLLNKRMGSKQ